MWTEQGLRAAAAHTLTHTRSRTHTPHTLTRVHAPSEPLQTRGGENRVCPVRIPERQARPVCGREPRRRAVRSAYPAPRPGPLCLRPPSPPEPHWPGAGGDAGLSSPAPPATPSSQAPPGGSWQASGEQALAALAQARPGPILFPFPLRNALTRRLLKKSCRKSILSRDCPQTRLDFY